MAGALTERIPLDRAVALSLPVLERRLVGQHVQHLLGIVLPVCGAVNIAALTDSRAEFPNERLGDEAALMMAGFAPGDPGIDMDAVKRFGRDHMLDHIDRVMTMMRTFFSSISLMRFDSAPTPATNTSQPRKLTSGWA